MEELGTEKYNYTVTALLFLSKKKKKKLCRLRCVGFGTATRQAISSYTALFNGKVVLFTISRHIQ